MKKLIILVAIAFTGWKIYQQYAPTPVVEWSNSETQNSIQYQTPEAMTRATTNAMRFTCDGREYCSEMTSRAEAEYFNRYCPNTKMDGDNDGIPCENDSRF